MALKRHFGMKSWTEWPDEGARLHRADALERYRAELRGDVELFTYIQFLFFRQWSALKSYINGLGIRIIGDIPIYVAMDSSDVGASRRNSSSTSETYPSRSPACRRTTSALTVSSGATPLRLRGHAEGRL